ncbi:MAG: hypothetical protein L3J66_13495 [Bacteroidales bacterium]|nr:hypothetical protein [Bacteroidales bacterium]
MKQFLKNFSALRFVKSCRGKAETAEQLETKHSQPSISHYCDSIYFSGISEEGMTFVARMAFRDKGQNENWLKIYIPGEGVWGFENRDMIVGEGFEQGKLKFVCEKPGKVWRVHFEGPVFQGKRYYQITLDLKWKASLPLVNFEENGISSDQLAFQIAKQEWDWWYSKQLKALVRGHYEQAGEIRGFIRWKRKKHKVQMKAIRYHSFGRLEWNDYERHFWFTGVLDDGRMLHCGLIDFDIVKGLKSGFICDKEKVVTFVKTPGFSQLRYQEGSSTNFSFKIRERGGETEKTVQVEMLELFTFEMDNVYSIRQAKAAFEYGGMKGMGIVEMGLAVENNNKQKE